ncbi:MAG TPA: cytochrome P450 [Ktedonobacteraceae bacterium]
MNEQQIAWQIGAHDAPPPPTIAAELAQTYAQGGNQLPVLLACYRAYGPIFRVPRQEKPLTVLAGPAANVFVGRYMTEILSEQAFWEGFIEEYTGKEAQVSHEGEMNRARRALLSPGYSRGRILDRLPLLADLTHQQTASWQPGQSVRFFPWVQQVIAEQLGQLLAHHGTEDYVPDLATFLSTTIQTTMTKSQARAALQAPSYLHAKERILEFGRKIVADHRATPPGQDRQPDVVDDLLMAAARGGRDIADQQLAFGALGPFLAGLHTVSFASCSLLYALLAHPQICARVVEEADAVFAQGTLSWERLKEMHALHGAAMEALRLYSGASGHNCQAIQPFSFAGYGVEAGEDVFVAMTVAHFLPELFPQPESFDSDRYSEPRNEHRQRGAYAPFGLGDHSCLGAGIAEVQLMATLATLLAQYELELDPADYRMQPLAQSQKTPQHELRVSIVKPRA